MQLDKAERELLNWRWSRKNAECSKEGEQSTEEKDTGMIQSKSNRCLISVPEKQRGNGS